MARTVREKIEPKQSTPDKTALLLTRFAPLLVLAVTACAYFNACKGPFLFDDVPNIVEAPSVQSLNPAVWLKPNASHAGAGRPLLQLSLAINFAIGRLNPVGYHAFNIVMHALAGLALLGVLRLILRRLNHPAGDTIALVVTLLWAVHPLLSEAVTYIINRSELLMAVFYLAAIYAFLRSLDSSRPKVWLIAAVILGMVSALAKEVAATLPFVMLLLDVLVVTGSWKETFRRRKWFYAGMLLICVESVLLLTTTRMSQRTGNAYAELTPWKNLLLQSEILIRYLELCFWPGQLNIDYTGWPVPASVVDVLPQGLTILVLLLATVYFAIRRKPAAMVGVWVFLILAPSSSIVPLPLEIGAERRMYLPLAAILLGVVLLVERYLRRLPSAGQIGSLAAIAIVAVLAVATLARNEDYSTTTSIWYDAVAKRPENPRAHNNLGEALLKQRDVPAAFACFTKAIEVAPGFQQARVNRAITLVMLGDPTQAADELREAMRRRPEDQFAPVTLAWVLSRQGNFDEAEAVLGELLRRHPGSADATLMLSDVQQARARAPK